MLTCFFIIQIVTFTTEICFLASEPPNIWHRTLPVCSVPGFLHTNWFFTVSTSRYSGYLVFDLSEHKTKYIILILEHKGMFVLLLLLLCSDRSDGSDGEIDMSGFLSCIITE